MQWPWILLTQLCNACQQHADFDITAVLFLQLCGYMFVSNVFYFAATGCALCEEEHKILFGAVRAYLTDATLTKLRESPDA